MEGFVGIHKFAKNNVRNQIITISLSLSTALFCSQLFLIILTHFYVDLQSSTLLFIIKLICCQTVLHIVRLVRQLVSAVIQTVWVAVRLIQRVILRVSLVEDFYITINA
jgi:hypothetical protein